LVSYFYHLSTIFYGFPKSGRKGKRKIMNSVGLNSAQVGLQKGEHARARARVVNFAQRTLVI
jgi:hypothetical protein